MTVHPCVPLVIWREHVDGGVLLPSLRSLNALLDPGPARRHRQQLVLGLRDFPSARQPLFEDPALRRWMQDLDRHWPFWFHFLDPQTPSLYGLMLLLCPLERTRHELQVQDRHYREFLDRHLAAMDALSRALDDPPATRIAMKEAIRHALF